MTRQRGSQIKLTEPAQRDELRLHAGFRANRLRGRSIRRQEHHLDDALVAAVDGVEHECAPARVDVQAGFLADLPARAGQHSLPRVRLALGVVTSIDPEILLLDEGIGAVDAAFLDKASDRLHDLVRRSGILVFASHSEDLLIEWCSTAIWLDGGRLHEHGPAADVIDHYSGRKPAIMGGIVGGGTAAI